MRRPIIAILTIGLAFPGTAAAKVDVSCSTTTMTSAITGRVENALGEPVQGILIELYSTNDARPVADKAVTAADGRYRICAGQDSGAGHNTYDVHATDLRQSPLYGTVNQPYSTFMNLTGDADFTPASGLPLPYLTNMTISPAEISTASGSRTVTWTVRSKAPNSTTMRLSLDHRSTDVTMDFVGNDGSSPSNGGWNRWTYQHTFSKNSTETLYWATVRGNRNSKLVTQMDRQPYVIDNKSPMFGLATSSPGECGPGVHANPISPASPPGTTNPRPIVVHGVCDTYSNGARSGLDPFSLIGRLCRNSAMTSDCSDINPVLSVNSIIWWPQTPLAVGNYYLRWTIADKAGNVATSSAQRLTITNKGGQRPVISAVQPGNLGSGNTAGIVIGASVTTPSSYPHVGFGVSDADGETDLVPGSLRVRIYHGDERTLVYDYDPTMPPNTYDPVTRRGGGSFDLKSFRATGFPLQAKPPGRYLATASISDHGGNSATMTWHWILVAAV